MSEGLVTSAWEAGYRAGVIATADICCDMLAYIENGDTTQYARDNVIPKWKAKMFDIGVLKTA